MRLCFQKISSICEMCCRAPEPLPGGDRSIACQTRCFSSDRARPSAFLRKKKEPAFSEGATELCGRHARNAPKNFAEGAWARVSDFERNLDEAAGGFTDELLCAGDPFSRHELQRRHPRRMLEHPGKMEGTQVHQL